MKRYRLIIQPPAFDDLDEAYQWIKERSPEAAARWFNGFVEAFSFPERQFLTYQIESNLPSSCQIGVRVISHLEKFMTNGIHQVIKLSSPVPADGKSITDKVSDEGTYESKCQIFYKRLSLLKD